MDVLAGNCSHLGEETVKFKCVIETCPETLRKKWVDCVFSPRCCWEASVVSLVAGRPGVLALWHQPPLSEGRRDKPLEGALVAFK